MGEYNNGHNCGRIIKVTIGRYCTGVNSGVPGKAFCEGGHLVDDQFTGAEQEYMVTDSCQDNNRWCRDDKFHTDLKTSSLKTFKKDGKNVDVSGKWGNREINWAYVKGPSSDVAIYWA